MYVYETKSMAQRLDGNTYPGRGIVLGITPDGTKAVAAYFIMGRSVNSRNRVFIQEPDGIRTDAHDPALMKDPHLIIYHPVREIGRGLIVTNGDQTDTIWEYLAKGESWESALRTRQFEDDGPNWTPRISGLQASDGSYKMSILKSADAEGSACARFFYEYPAIAGLGHFLHTYVCDGNPVIPTSSSITLSAPWATASSSPTVTRPTPSGSLPPVARAGRLPSAPAALRTTAPTGRPVSPACFPATAATRCPF